MSKQKKPVRAGHGVPYGEIADKARAVVSREGCAHLKDIWPGTGTEVCWRRNDASRALKRTPGVVEVFPAVFAREDVALSIRALIDAAKVRS
jgi:hypothetical protein